MATEPIETSAEKALVLLSGGQDSTTCLAWTLARFAAVETIGFDYGQRHRVELDCRRAVIARLRREFPDWDQKLGEDHLIDLRVLGEVSDTALTRDSAIRFAQSGLPNTFVPGRNLLFFTFAAAIGYRRSARHLIGGMCETDYSGYPDCRDDTLKALQATLSLGMEHRFVVHTPLMWRDKAATWELAQVLGGDALVELVREETHSCYHGDRVHRHSWGYGCGECPACELRRRGWEAFIRSPLPFPPPLAGEGEAGAERDVSYAVKEIFYTLQGEGAQTGRPAVFCRFAGCNLWSGREADRARALCSFCDTDFVGTDGTDGGRYPNAAALAERIALHWPHGAPSRFVVCTGGEPLLQLDPPLIAALHERGFEVAVETNGTIPPPPGLDWVCVSPKAGAGLVVERGDELKIVVPQQGLDPLDFAHFVFRRFSVQPMDGPDRARNTELALAFCRAHPQWHLSLQTHKLIGFR